MSSSIKRTVSCGYTLSSLLEQVAGLRQIRKTDVRAGDHLYIVTENSVYHVRVAGNGSYLVSGGWFDRKGVAPLKTTIAGCTWGGSALKIDIVAACGLSVEFGNRLVTSTVRKVIVLPFGRVN